MLAQQQETAVTAAQMYSSNPYGNLTDVTNINHISPIQTTTNNYNASISSSSDSVQSVLNLSNTQQQQMYAKNMLMNLQQQANMQLDQQQQPMSTTIENNNNGSSSSYKSPQSPSFRSYHHSNQQPYKIPSQNSGYNATSRIMMRQQSPPLSSTQMCKSMSFQQQQHQHQQQQSATAAAIKEMYRSNSLPINANIQLPKECGGGFGSSADFAMPKYPNVTATSMPSSSSSAVVGGGVKGRNSRSRSNSINLRHNQLLMTPIQSATSEPTLNATSALAQLLTNNSSSSLLGQKSHSISSSAMSLQSQQQQQHVQPQRAKSFTSTSLVPNAIIMAVSSAAAAAKQQQQSHQQQATSTSSTPMYQTPELSPESTYQEGTSSSSHHHEMPSLSPERCLSLGKFHPRENNRRAGHIHAEQKRRYNIKNGFDMLHSLIPQLQQNPNAKVNIFYLNSKNFFLQ